ncbi:MAG: hypothetical protein ACR2I2_13410 [Bryobacteraceae bacterium]
MCVIRYKQQNNRWDRSNRKLVEVESRELGGDQIRFVYHISGKPALAAMGNCVASLNRGVVKSSLAKRRKRRSAWASAGFWESIATGWLKR